MNARQLAARLREIIEECNEDPDVADGYTPSVIVMGTDGKLHQLKDVETNGFKYPDVVITLHS